MCRLNTFTTVCEGRRLSIFAGSGVGKSALMSMLARNTNVDLAVIGLFGERGREVHEFIQEYLGEVGLAHTVVVVATSDEAVLMRRQAAHMSLILSEYFRDQGKRVLCMIDSLTQFAMAQREIGLAIGELPYTQPRDSHSSCSQNCCDCWKGLVWVHQQRVLLPDCLPS
ncbi:MAG: hypothetical protein MO846_06150 [Candidatus Devosia symbiotica]|nr:hypothetical protein [Candidatus Devosia symbiotica]